MTTITLDNVLAKLKKAMDTQGPEHTVRCEYFDTQTGKPICLIATLLHQEGFDLSRLASSPYYGNSTRICSIYGANATVSYGTSAFGEVQPYLPSIEPEALYVLQQAQQVQDSGRTWGEAYAMAESMVDRILTMTEIQREALRGHWTPA